MSDIAKEILQVEIEQRNEINIVGKLLRTTFEGGQQAREIPPFFHQTVVNGDMESIPGRLATDQYCIVQLTPGSQEFGYVIGVETCNGSVIPDNMITLTIPSQTYAVLPFIKRGNKNVLDAYRYILETWLPESGYRSSDGPNFIYYKEPFFTIYKTYGYEGNPTASTYVSVEKIR